MRDVTIVDCAPRDGLSKVKGNVPTSDKIALINSLGEAGVPKIDCVAFTHPRVMPKESDAERVIAGIQKTPGTRYIGLASTEVGCRRAALTEIDEVHTYVAASEVFNKRVLNLEIKVTLNKVLPAIIDAALSNKKSVRVMILTAFGCPYSGRVPSEILSKIVSTLSFMGANEICLVDTTGMANPRTARERIDTLLQLQLKARLAVHFHDNRGTAVANALSSYEAGVRIFDTAIGGLSGTAYSAPELEIGYWNIPTEDLVNVFEEMDISTGIDLQKLLSCAELAEQIAGQKLRRHVLLPKEAVFKSPEDETV